MKQELVSQAFGNIDEALIAEAYRPVNRNTLASPAMPAHIQKKPIILFPFAAALIIVIGITAYAVWSIHIARQQELKADLKIEENNVNSYKEYDLTGGREASLVLLSSANDGQWHRIYLDVSPVTEEEATGVSEGKVLFSCSIDRTDIFVNATPKMPVGTDLSGRDEIQKAILENAYDKDSQTMTLECYINADHLKKAMTDLKADSIPLRIDMYIIKDQEEKIQRTLGSVLYTPAEEQKRYFNFENIYFHDEELDKELEIIGMELTPFGAVWKVCYDDAESVHAPEANIEMAKPWLTLEDKVCSAAQLVFKDGSALSTGSVLSSPYEDGVVNLECSWERAINIDEVQRIVLDSQIIWDHAS